MSDAAGGQHHRTRSDGDGTRRHIAGVTELKPGDGAVLGQQRLGDKAFDQTDRRRVSHGLAERRNDCRARHVTAHMYDAPRRMRGFATHREPALEIAVEGHAVVEKIVNARCCLACNPECDCFIDETSADCDGVGRMRFGAVTFADRCRDAALRPGG